MATMLHNSGEQYQMENTIGVSSATDVDVGLFHDGEVSGDTTAGDDLADSDTDPSTAITTEPSGASYAGPAPVTLSLDNTDFSVVQNGDGNYQIESAASHSFDLSDDDTGVIDAYYVQVEYDSGSGAAEHLYWTGNLSQSYDVGSVGTLEINAGGIGISLD